MSQSVAGDSDFQIEIWKTYFRADTELPGLLHVFTGFDIEASRAEIRIGSFQSTPEDLPLIN